MTPSFNLRPVDILLYAKLCLGLGGDSWVFSPVIRDPICARGFWRTAAQSLPLPRMGVGVFLTSTQRFQMDRFPVVRGDLGNSWSYKTWCEGT